ncbi:MAG: LuxR C-terminal-related transcriptional regulator [Burkholderiaceae bacterium]
MEQRLVRETRPAIEPPAKANPDDRSRQQTAVASLRLAVQPRAPASAPFDTPIRSDACGYLLNRDVRVLGVERAGRLSSPLASHGLQLSEGRLLPLDADLVDRWKALANQTITTGQGLLFKLGKLAADGCVVLSPGPRPGTVHVRLRRPAVLDEETIAAVARLTGMSVRESQVFGMLLAGMPPKEISAELRTSLSTVRSQVKSVLAKSGYRGMRDLVAAMACMPSVSGVPENDATEQAFQLVGGTR